MRDVYITAAARTPIGAQGRSLKEICAVDLGAAATAALFKKNKIKKTLVGEVILGNAVGAGLGQNPARQVLIKAGLSVKTPAFTVNHVCGSGIRSVILGAQSIRAGSSEVIVAGGMESASGCPYIFPRKGGLENLDPARGRDSLVYDGLWCRFNDSHMGVLAEWTARRFKIPRSQQDVFALESHRRAIRAQDEGLFRQEIVSIQRAGRVILEHDEKPRRDISLEQLGRLPAAFVLRGTVTAGNSPAPADGAAVVLLASGQAVKKNKMTPQARVLGWAAVAVEPKSVFTASALAAQRCLKTAGLRASQVDLFEITESFAVQALLTQRLLKLDSGRVNVFGGAIALGHPLGASGSRALVTLLQALSVHKKNVGLVSICLGGGEALSIAIRRQ